MSGDSLGGVNSFSENGSGIFLQDSRAMESRKWRRDSRRENSASPRTSLAMTVAGFTVCAELFFDSNLADVGREGVCKELFLDGDLADTGREGICDELFFDSNLADEGREGVREELFFDGDLADEGREDA